MRANDALAGLSATERDGLRETAQPEWIEPMLAKLSDRRFDDERWIFERKFDGVRLLAYRDGGKVRLFSRNRLAQNGTYPELVEALEVQASKRFVADGEVVAFRGRLTSFSRLQGRMGLSNPAAAHASGFCARPSTTPIHCATRPTATPRAKAIIARPAQRAGRASSPSVRRAPTPANARETG